MLRALLWGGGVALLLGAMIPSNSAWARPKADAAMKARLLKQARSGKGMDQLRAIDRLGRLRVYKALPILRKILRRSRKSSTLLLQMSILGLGRLRDRKSRRTIERLALNHRVFRIRRASLWALRMIGSRASVPAFLRLLKKAPTSLEVQYAVWGLRRFRDPAHAKHLYPLLLRMSSHICLETWRYLRRLKKIKRGRTKCSGRDIRNRRKDKQWLEKLRLP